MKHIVEDLKASGLTTKDVHVSPIKGTTAYKIHYHDRDGADTGFYRIKQFDAEPKYKQPLNTVPEVYWPTNFDWAVWSQLSAPRPLYITEGEKKAACATKNGYPAIGLGGVWSFKSGFIPLIAGLAELDWENIQPYFVFDHDRKLKSRWQVKMAESQLFLRLQERGAVAKVVRLPLDKTSDKIGWDDFLVADGNFDKLVASAEVGSVYDIRDTYFEQPMAEAFVADSMDHLRYLTDRQQWITWAGDRWSRDETAARFRLSEFIKRSLPEYPSQKECEAETAENGKAAGERLKTAIKQLRSKMSTARYADAVLKLAANSPAIAATEAQFDVDPLLLGIPEGKVVDLRTGETRSTKPEDYLTRSTRVLPTAKAECKEFKQFLRDVTDGDNSFIEYLQVLVGYCLTGNVNAEVLPINYGPGGNGKGTLWGTIAYAMGDADSNGYCIGDFPIEAMLEKKFVNDYSIQNDLARLQGVRLAITDEGEKQRQLSATLLKKFSGGPCKLTAKHMRQDKFDFGMTHKLVLMMNNHPRLEVDEAIARRLHLIPFLQRWTSKIGEQAAKNEVHQADEGLKNRLKAEAPGILRWGIEGAKKWIAKGLVPPKVVAEYTVNFFDHADPYETWLTECGHELNKPDYFTPTTTLWEDWLEYCKRTRQRAGASINTFSEELAKRDHLFEPGRPKRKGHQRVRGFFGVKMKNVHNIERSFKIKERG